MALAGVLCFPPCVFAQGVLVGIQRQVPIEEVIQPVPFEGVLIQGVFTMAELNPAPGVVDLEPLIRFVEGAGGRPVVVKLASVSGDVDPKKRDGASPPVNTATPAYICADPGSACLGGIETKQFGRLDKYPVYWSESYKAAVEDFLIQLHRAVYEDPAHAELAERIAAWRLCFWCMRSTEPNFYKYVGRIPEVADQIRQFGYTNYRDTRHHSVDSPYAQAVSYFLNTLRKIFPDQRLIFTYHVRPESSGPSFESVTIEEARKLGFVMLNTGLNERDHSSGRARLRAWADEGSEVGWGGITHLGKNATLLDAFMQGVGCTAEDPACVPGGLLLLSHASYVTMEIGREGWTSRQQEAYAWVLPRLFGTSGPVVIPAVGKVVSTVEESGGRKPPPDKFHVKDWRWKRLRKAVRKVYKE